MPIGSRQRFDGNRLGVDVELSEDRGMIKLSGVVGFGALLCTAAAASAAGDTVDVSAGRALAKQWCSECHDVRPGGQTSPNLYAPTFGELAALPGVTELSLRAMLRNDHLTMPAIKFPAGQMDDIVGYLISLKPAPC
jgi:mono/diheme cytochrome c family protein